MKKRFLLLSVMVLSSMALLYSCSSNKANNTPTPTPTATTTDVSIQNFAFVPDTVKIKTGSSVTWTNKDSAPHTATDLNKAFDSGSLSTNGTFKFVFATPGTYTYVCLIHSMMKKATVIVSN